MFAKKIGIDLGTSTVQVYVRGEGIVVDGPALVALRRVDSAVVAVGQEAAELLAQGAPGSEGRPHAICDLGGGSSQVAVLALSGIVVAHSAPGGGEALDEAIAGAVKERHGALIDARAAQAVKLAVGAALPADAAMVTEVRGQ